MTLNPLALTLLFSASALSGVAAAQPAYRMDSYLLLNGKTQPAFAWCDAPDRVLALTNPATQPATPQPVTLARWLKRAPNKVQTGAYRLGPGEGAAGTIFVGLNPASRPESSANENGGNVRLSNVQNVNDPTYRMSAVGGFKTSYEDVRCRYVPDAAFMGVTAKRTVIIWENGGKITYATRNFDGTPGVLITGGRVLLGVEGGRDYTFSAPNGFVYRVIVEPYGPSTGASLNVFKGDIFKDGGHFLAYSVSSPLTSTQEQP